MPGEPRRHFAPGLLRWLWRHRPDGRRFVQRTSCLAALRGPGCSRRASHSEEGGEILRELAVDAFEELDRITVALPLSMHAESCTADDVGGGNTRMYTQSDVRVDEGPSSPAASDEFGCLTQLSLAFFKRPR